MFFWYEIFKYNVHRKLDVYPSPNAFKSERQSAEKNNKESVYSNLYFAENLKTIYLRCLDF